MVQYIRLTQEKTLLMNTESIGFTTRSVAIRRGDDRLPAWTAQILTKKAVDDEEFCAAVAAQTRQSPADVNYIFSVASDVLRDFLRQGRRVNLRDVGFGLTLTGKFPSADAAPDAARNAVRVSASAKPSLAKAFDLSELSFENVTRPLSAHIFSVMDATLRQDGVVADSSHVLITGEGLKVDQSADDEGVWLVDADGTAVATGMILENDAATLDCSFAGMPSPGSYRIEVRARNGASPSFAPAIVHKTIEVK